MKPIQKIALGVAGITLLVIGALMLACAHAFYASYGINLAPDPSLLSELRAPGAGLAAFGAVMLAGIVRPALRQTAVIAALTVLLAFPVGRIVGLLGALVLELGMAGVSVLIAGYSWVALSGPAATLIGVAALVYLVGCFGVTVAFNVPMNEALAGMDLRSQVTQAYWVQSYVPHWTFWNSARTGAAMLSAALLLFGLLWMTQSPSQPV